MRKQNLSLRMPSEYLNYVSSLSPLNVSANLSKVLTGVTFETLAKGVLARATLPPLVGQTALTSVSLDADVRTNLYALIDASRLSNQDVISLAIDAHRANHPDNKNK